MNLYNFEDLIDLNVIEKGRICWENDFVLFLEGIGENSFTAEVRGAENYKIQVLLDTSNGIISAACNCHHTGSYCKHIIAVLYKLRDLSENGLKGFRKQEKPSVNNAESDLRKLLIEKSNNELVDFLISLTNQYKEINSQIRLQFFSGDEGEEIKLCKELIEMYIKQNSDKDGYVSYYQSFEAVKGAKIVMKKARDIFFSHNYYHSIGIILCVIHELMKLMRCSDDSGSVVGDLLHESFDLIEDIIVNEQNIGSTEKQKLFYKLMEESSNKRYDNWIEFRLSLMENSVYLAFSPELRSLLEHKLESILENKQTKLLCTNHLKERVNLIKYKLIEKYEDKRKAEDFIQRNLNNTCFRKIAINNAFNDHDYSLAINLALQGEEQDKQIAGLVWQWKAFRYDAYKLSGQLKEQRSLAMDFILEGDFEYYIELKNNYSKEEWKKIYPEIISVIEDNKRTFISSYTNILIEEGEFRKLLDYVRANPSSLELFNNHLTPKFEKEIYEIFNTYIEEISSRAASRKDYNVVCNMLRRLCSAVRREDMAATVKHLLDEYSDKPEFCNELRNLQLS